jgi:hypothetical protein
MPREIWNVEWPNVNAQRKYPFAQSASLSVGDFQLPNSLIVDFVLAVNVSAAPDPGLFHLKQLGVFGSGIVMSFAYNDTVFATVNVVTSSFVPYNTVALQGTGAFADARGWVTIGQVSEVMQYPGAYTFPLDAGRLLPTVIRPRLSAVSSLSVVNGTDVSPALTGDIALIAGRNIRFRVDTSGGTPAIIVDAISGEGTVVPCSCSDLDEAAPCIRTINGVAPTDNGGFYLVGSECVEITPGEAALNIKDSCSTPCCDCRELTVVTDTLGSLQNQMQTMEMTAQRLDLELKNTRGNILASKTTGLPPS